MEYPGLARDPYWFNTTSNKNREAYQQVLTEARSEVPGMQTLSGVTQETHLSEEHQSVLLFRLRKCQALFNLIPNYRDNENNNKRKYRKTVCVCV